MDGTKIATFICMLLLCLAIYGCESYKFKDCKNVGHSTGYCVLKIGK